MRIDKVILAGLVASGLALASGTASAQPAGTVLLPGDAPDITIPGEGEQTATAAPPTAERDPKNNWLKVCDTTESGERACILRQLVIKGGQFAGSFTLRDDPGQENRLVMVAAVPLGILLFPGMVWQIDSARPFRTPFVTCDPRSCVSQALINEAYVDSLKKGAKLFVTVKNLQNRDLVVEFDLAGFTAVYESEEAMTIDEFQAQETGQAALEQLLQQRAESVRQERESGGGGTDGTGGDGGTP